MAKEKFKEINLDGSINITMDRFKGVWQANKREVINNMVLICSEYLSQGYKMTLRQLYYQLVARDMIPNHDKVYKKISTLKDAAVYSGLIDWDIFEDRGRVPHTPYSEDSIQGALQNTIDFYRLDRQLDQPNHIEVWTEKDAISNVLKNVTRPYGITLVVNKGYTSSTAIYEAYKRFEYRISKGQKVKILYFGDHDPSGLDMIRDIENRLKYMFINGVNFLERKVQKWWEHYGYDIYDVCAHNDKYEDVAKLGHSEGTDKLYDLFEAGRKEMYLDTENIFEVVQVGLTMDQIKHYNPPSNPAKMTDPRQKEYVKKFGQISWEVDALTPSVMSSIVKEAIVKQLDSDIYEKVLKREKADKNQIEKIINNL